MAADGEVYACSESFVATDTPELASVRARVVVPVETDVCAASGLSALWIHGLSTAPQKHSVCLCTTKRANHSVLDSRVVRSLTHVDGELSAFSHVAVLSPVRALVEVLQDPLLQEGDVTDVLCRVSRTLPGLVQSARQLINALPRGGYRSLARERLALADTVDVVDSIDSSHGVQNAFELHDIGHFKDEPAQSQSA